jgi:hypothetical protein
VKATVIGDANQDDNSGNDRIPGARRNSFVPTTQPLTCGFRASFTSKTDGSSSSRPESFNLFNRLNRRFQLTDHGIMSNAALFKFGTKHLGVNYFPAYYQVPTNFMRATSAYAPRQIQFAPRMAF